MSPLCVRFRFTIQILNPGAGGQMARRVKKSKQRKNAPQNISLVSPVCSLSDFLSSFLGVSRCPSFTPEPLWLSANWVENMNENIPPPCLPRLCSGLKHSHPIPLSSLLCSLCPSLLPLPHCLRFFSSYYYGPRLFCLTLFAHF